MQACTCLLSSLYQLFDLCLIKHALTVWPLTLTLVCLVTKQCLVVFGRQIFPICPGLYCLPWIGTNIFYSSSLRFM